MRLSVVIPCYRSEDSIRPLVETLDAELDGLVGAGDYEILLVNDGSPDGTGQAIDSLAASSAAVTTIHLRRNYGQHNALVAGIRAAQGDVTVTMDDDGQHRPDQIALLLAPLDDQSVDLVYGIAAVEEHGFARSLASRSVKAALGTVGVENARWVSAFRAFRTEARDAFVRSLDADVNVDVLLSWSTNKVTAVKVAMERRTVGRSNYSVLRLMRHSLNMVTGYSAFPLRVASWIGGLSALLGIVLLVTVLVQYFLGGTTVAGFTTTIAVIAIFSGAQLTSIGLIGEYLGRQHFRAMHKPMYLVRSVRRDSAGS